MKRPALAVLLLATGHSVAAGCGDVTGDVIVRATPRNESCIGDDDCAPPSPRCELASGACVACLVADDCPAEQLCAVPANVCAQRCAPASCGGNAPVCDSGTGLCRPCGTDAECPLDTPHCLAPGACVECRVQSDCSPEDDEDEDEPRLCDPAGRCVECTQDGDCEDVGERCNRFVGVCAEPCSATVPCRYDDPICDENTGFCVECRNDSECEDGVLCRGSECVD